MEKVEKRIVVVTGGCAGIGRAIAEAFLVNQDNVIVFDQDQDNVKKINSSQNPNFKAKLVDITKKAEIDQIVEEVINEYQRIDVLVNSAGVARLAMAVEANEKDWDLTMDVNVKGLFFMSQAVGRQMIKQNNGRIINIASQAGVVGFERHAAYTASKASVIGLTKVLAMEWAKYGVLVNAISPTIIMTELGKKAWAGPVGDDMKKRIPLGRFGEPEEIANCAFFLASAQSSLITGTNLVADGGYIIQ